MAETLAQLMHECGVMPPKDKEHEGLDDRWRPYLDKKVLIVKRSPDKKKGQTITGVVTHYGSWPHASIIVAPSRCVDVKFDDIISIKLWEPKPTALNAADIQSGHWYRSHHPRKPLFSNDYDDRLVLWIGGDSVQYDSISVRNGRHYPTVKMDVFLRWAAMDLSKSVETEGK